MLSENKMIAKIRVIEKKVLTHLIHFLFVSKVYSQENKNKRNAARAYPTRDILNQKRSSLVGLFIIKWPYPMNIVKAKKEKYKISCS